MGHVKRSRAVRLKRGRTFLAKLLVTTALAAAFGPMPQAARAEPAAAPGQRTFSIPQGPLPAALAAFGRQSGLQVTYLPEIASGVQSPGASGALSPGQALAGLLVGSGLTYRFANAHTVTIERPRPVAAGDAPAGALALDTIDVQGQTNPATTEGTNSYGSGFATVAGKVPVSLKETPQSVSVVTRQRIEDQELFTLDQAIANTTGMVVQQGDSDRPAYYSRGFPVNVIEIDGVPTNIALPTSAQDLAMYDRVEVLKGPAGLLDGLGSPGGTINLVRKLPLSEFHFVDQLTAGSFGNIRNEFDVSSPLNESKTVRARIVGTVQSQDFIEDTAYRKLGQIYGVIEADLSDSTTARAGGYYQSSTQRQNWVGVPVTTDYQFVNASRSTFFGAPWNLSVYSQTGGFAEVEHKFDNGWKTKATANYIRYRSNIVESSIAGQVDPVNLTGDVEADSWAQNDQQMALDWFANGPVPLFGRTHQLTFGIDLSHEDLEQKNFYGPPDNRFYDQTLNIFNLNIAKPAFDGGVYGRHTITNEYGGFANARISIAAPMTLVLGGRMIWWNNTYKPNPGENYFDETIMTDRISARAIPFAGLIFDVNGAYSLYASYAEIFQPQAQRDASNKLLPPVEGEQYEAGVKATYFDNRLNASLAFFSLTEQNRALQDQNDPTGTIYFAEGKARAQGIEAEVSGHITEGWDIYAGYTFTQTTTYDNSQGPDFTSFTAIAPTHLFKLWTTYNLPGEFSKWTVGGGANVSSEFYNYDSGGRLVAPAFATFAATVSYKIDQNFDIALNVDNILDTKYIRSLGGTAGGFYGDPRTFLVRMRAKF